MTAVWRCQKCQRERGGEGITTLLDARYGSGHCAGCRTTRMFTATGQQPTFSDRPGLVRRDHPDTSHIAAATIPRTGTLRRAVYDAIHRTGDEGMTDSELQRALDMDGNTERPRRVELIDAGLIKDSGRRRYEGGRPMIVWVVVP